jgi:uncharacterized protein (DUF2141 family)
MIGFGTVRNTTYIAEDSMPLTEEAYKMSQALIPSQAGWNRGDSQKGTTGFGAPRDVHGMCQEPHVTLAHPHLQASTCDVYGKSNIPKRRSRRHSTFKILFPKQKIQKYIYTH